MGTLFAAMSQIKFLEDCADEYGDSHMLAAGVSISYYALVGVLRDKGRHKSAGKMFAKTPTRNPKHTFCQENPTN